MTSRERFEYACSLLPSDVCWNEEITPDTVLHIAAMVERSALERAAQLCESESKGHAPSFEDYSHQACLDCAEAIRALLDAQSKDTEGA